MNVFFEIRMHPISLFPFLFLISKVIMVHHHNFFITGIRSWHGCITNLYDVHTTTGTTIVKLTYFIHPVVNNNDNTLLIIIDIMHRVGIIWKLGHVILILYYFVRLGASDANVCAAILITYSRRKCHINYIISRVRIL